MAAKVVADSPPRSKTTVGRRSGPSSARSSGSSRTSSLARLAAGGAVTTSTGSASASAHPGLGGGVAGQVHPGDVGLGQVPGAGVDPDVPVDVEEPERVRVY